MAIVFSDCQLQKSGSASPCKGILRERLPERPVSRPDTSGVSFHARNPETLRQPFNQPDVADDGRTNQFFQSADLPRRDIGSSPVRRNTGMNCPAKGRRATGRTFPISPNQQPTPVSSRMRRIRNRSSDVLQPPNLRYRVVAYRKPRLLAHGRGVQQSFGFGSACDEQPRCGSK